MTFSLQWERVRSFLSDKDIGWFWVPIHDKQNEGQWRDFYNNQVLNITTPWFTGEPNGGSGQNCAASLNGAWYDEPCELKHACLCERQRSYHMRLRGLCADSAVDKYYQPINNFSDFARLTLVGQRGSTIEYDVNNNNWKLSLAGYNVSGLSHLHMNQSQHMPIFRILNWKQHKEAHSNGRTTLKMTIVLNAREQVSSLE